MTEQEHFILQACEQHGFEAVEDSHTGEVTYIVTPEELIAMVKLAHQEGQLDALGLLGKAADKFRFYEQQHLAKIPFLEREREHDATYQIQINATREKARVHAAMAQEIEDFIDAR